MHPCTVFNQMWQWVRSEKICLLLFLPLQSSSYDTAVYLSLTQTMGVSASRLSKETSP